MYVINNELIIEQKLFSNCNCKQVNKKEKGSYNKIYFVMVHQTVIIIPL